MENGLIPPCYEIAPPYRKLCSYPHVLYYCCHWQYFIPHHKLRYHASLSEAFLPRTVDNKNKKVIGLMKDELGGGIMKEFVSLRPKMYSYRMEKNEAKKCKGIKKCVVKKTITFDDYKDCLFKGKEIYKSQLLFRSDKHDIKTLEVNKLALNSQDDKRISIDGIASYTMGHYKTV